MKHTPGPWIIGKGTYECRNIYAATPAIDDEGFEFHPCIATIEDNDVDCWDGNLRLISAAPDLLEALKALDNAFMAHTFWNGDLPYEIIQARHAIAKVTGEPT